MALCSGRLQVVVGLALPLCAHRERLHLSKYDMIEACEMGEMEMSTLRGDQVVWDAPVGSKAGLVSR